MTLKVDGTNGVLQAYDYQVLTTGFSYTFAAGTQVLVINPAGTLATGTVTMPASPVDGMVITVVSTQQVTAVTIAANTGQTLVGGATQLIPNQPLSFMYRSSNTTWYPYAGGAGRASTLVAGTSVSPTTSTTVTFTGIPSWARRITITLSGVSQSPSDYFTLRIGSGSLDTTSYSTELGLIYGLGNCNIYSPTSYFYIVNSSTSVSASGHAVLTNISGNTWVLSGSMGDAGGRSNTFGGTHTTSGVLDRVQLSSSTGTSQFTSGTINILYE